MTELQTAGPRRVAKWRSIVDGTRRDNPQSIRRFLFDYIIHDHGYDAASLEFAISAMIDRIPPREKRHYHQKIRKEWLYQATRDNKIIDYGHIEILARTIGVPTALILIYTRMYSEFQSEEKIKADKSLRILYALRNALDKIIGIIEGHRGQADIKDTYIAFEDFEVMRRAYSEKFDEILPI